MAAGRLLWRMFVITMATILMEMIHNVRMALVPGLFLCFLLLRPAIPCAAASPPLVLGNTTDSAPLSGHIDVLEDKSGKLTIEEHAPGHGRALQAGQQEGAELRRDQQRLLATLLYQQ